MRCGIIVRGDTIPSGTDYLTGSNDDRTKRSAGASFHMLCGKLDGQTHVVIMTMFFGFHFFR
jgi:hypothetical protein